MLTWRAGAAGGTQGAGGGVIGVVKAGPASLPASSEKSRSGNLRLTYSSTIAEAAAATVP
jgi:hypothetical protein